MIRVLNLSEGDVQFRRAGDANALEVRRVPPSLACDLLQWSGEESAKVNQESVVRLVGTLSRAEGDWNRVVRQLLAWLGSVTWPAEAIAGDGQLARRMLGELDPALIVKQLPELADPAEVMGVVVWAASQEDDAAVMSAIGPAVTRLLHGP
ncbi:hypothetical protein [Micromonospora carbonacea]|uniref:hypothetical protein n=1 Tax=Micromonospora carbonacea TaxID=47853 RepID=UPI003D72C40F